MASRRSRKHRNKPRQQPSQRQVSKKPEVEVVDNTRRRISFGLGAAAILGLVGINLFGKESEKEDPIPNKRKSEARDSVSAVRDRVKQIEVPKSFSLGPFEFAFVDDFPNEKAAEVVRTFTQAYPILSKYIPMEGVEAKKITLKWQKGGQSRVSLRQSFLLIGLDGTEGINIHELVHLMHDENDLDTDLIEEGLANVLAVIASRELGIEYSYLKSMDDLKAAYSPSLEQGMGYPLNLVYSHIPTLLGIRYKRCSDMWEKLEETYPGFIKAFHEKYYQYLQKGGKKLDFMDQALLFRLAEEIAPGSSAIFRKSNLIYENYFEEETRKMIYAYHLISDKGRRVIKIIGIEKRRSDGNERVITDRRIDYWYTNPQNGRVSSRRRLPFKTGAMTMVLDRPSINMILREIGKTDDHYLIHLESFGVTETLKIPAFEQ